MNWIKKTLRIGEKIKRLINKHRPTKEEMEKSDWTSCCKGPILKKDLEDNLWCCNLCGKHHRISSRQRFDVFFGKNNYEIETKIFKHCEHRIPTEGSSLGLQFIKKHFNL